MAETYVECLVKQKNKPMAVFIRNLMIGLAIASAIMTFMFTHGAIVFLLVVMASIFALGAYLMHLQLNIEYEYLYLDKELSVDKIRAQQKRKKVADYDLNKMEIFAPIRSHELDSYKKREVKTVNYSTGVGGEKDERYVMYYDGKLRIVLSPSPALIAAIKNVAPRKVFEY